MKNGYTKFSYEILDRWLTEGIGYLSVQPLLSAREFEYGDQFAFRVLPVKEFNNSIPRIYPLSGEDVVRFADNDIDFVIYLVSVTDIYRKQ